jgi:PAS domain S-box-containing protein
MKEQYKTREQLIEELAEMHQRMAEWKASEAERRRVEEALRESEERYRTILENIEDGYYEVDITGNLTFFNDSLCRLCRYSADELMGMNNRQYMDDKTAKAVYRTYNTVYQTGKPAQAFDWEVIRKDGTRGFVQVSVSLMRGPTGEPVGFRGIIRDITERKQAEEALRKAHDELEIRVEERTAELAEANKELQAEIAERKLAEEALGQREAVLGAMALAAEKFLRPSDWEQDMQAALAYLGKAADAIRVIIWEASTSEDGKCLVSGRYEWLAPEAKIVALRGLQNVPMFRRWRGLLPRGEIITGHVRDFSAKEQEFFVPRGIASVLAVPIFVNDAWWGFMGFDQGETGREWTEAEIDTLKTVADMFGRALERKRVEEALRESEEKYRTILENIEDGYYEVDIVGNLTFFNDSLCKLYGYPEDKLMGMNYRQYMDDETAKRVYQTYNTIYQTGKPAQAFDWEVIRKDGTRRFVQVSVSLMRGPTGEPVGFRGINRDITERKAAEEALKEYSERLEEMVEERTKELREAQEQLIRQEKLAVLGQLAGGVGHELRNPLGAISNAVYFLNMVLEEPDPEVQETLEILQKEVKTSERTISGLLDFARTKAPTRRKVHLKEVVQETLSRATVPENVEVVSQLDGRLPAILADPDQLGQVFGNIILNAVQAMPEGGRLVVKSQVPSPEWVAISFTDTGVGIPEDNLSKLFEPLFTTKAKGIGLGMAVTKTLVEGHGGTIEVESEVGKGSTFTVKLPTGK